MSAAIVRTPVTSPLEPAGHIPSRQGGAVLVISLILLAVMTILGVAAMTSTSMEEKMAANTQENNRAFNAAETGLTEAFEDPGSTNLSQAQTITSHGIGGSTSITTGSVTTFRAWTNPPLGSLYSATSFQAAHFDSVATGATSQGAEVELHGGMYQIAPRL